MLLHIGTRIGQASECFVYWKDPVTSDTWGLNFTSPIDAKQFRECCVSHCNKNNDENDKKYCCVYVHGSRKHCYLFVRLCQTANESFFDGGVFMMVNGSWKESNCRCRSLLHVCVQKNTKIYIAKYFHNKYNYICIHIGVCMYVYLC